MSKKLFCTVLLLSGILADNAFAWKTASHLISLPLIEGAGIYASVSTLTNAENDVSKAAAGTNIGLLAANATLGTVAMFLPGEKREKLRLVHRIMGFTITAAGVWLSVANGLDDGLEGDATRAITYGYTGLTVIPVILFSF